MTDTIAAISTAFGEAAISVLRVSGAEALDVAAKVFHGGKPMRELMPRVQHYGRIVDGDGRTVDNVLLTIFRGPASYTGEDVIEISAHGGILLTKAFTSTAGDQRPRVTRAGGKPLITWLRSNGGSGDGVLLSRQK